MMAEGYTVVDDGGMMCCSSTPESPVSVRPGCLCNLGISDSRHFVCLFVLFCSEIIQEISACLKGMRPNIFCSISLNAPKTSWFWVLRSLACWPASKQNSKLSGFIFCML